MRGPCPCGTGQPYTACCGRWHGGDQHLQAPDALALMRSRYTAYSLNLGDYILQTWHPSTRPAQWEPMDPQLRWLGLEIRQHRVLSPTQATVEFVARSKLGGRAHRLHEISEFILEEGRWTYLRGELLKG